MCTRNVLSILRPQYLPGVCLVQNHTKRAIVRCVHKKVEMTHERRAEGNLVRYPGQSHYKLSNIKNTYC